MHKTLKKTLSIILAVLMIVTSVPFAFAADTPTEKNITLGTTALKGGQQSKVYFGTYQQSSNGNGGYNIDPIKWRVLSNTDDKLFLLSDQKLDVFQYHKEYEAVTWETSTMRSWLNGLANNKGNGENAIDYTNDNFLNTAFSASEQTAIADTTVVNNDNLRYDTDGGNNTTDKVFLLSIEEVQNTAYGFTDDETRKSTNTAYVANGGKIGTSADSWNLRSPGMYTDNAADVNIYGAVNVVGSHVNSPFYAVRPAFNINLPSVLFTSAANGSAQTDFAEAKDYTGNEWKLTLKDDNSFADASVDKTALAAGETLTVTHKALSSFTGAGYNNVTAMLTDGNGNILCYGSVGSDTSETKSSITIPGRLAAGTYTLSVYGEDWNGENMTDYATGTPFTTTITVTEHIIHNIVQVDAKANTCTTVGWDAYEYCKACDYTTYKEIPVLEHIDDNGDYKCDYGCSYVFEHNCYQTLVPNDDIKTPVTCSICDSTIYESDSRWAVDIYENLFEGMVAKFKGFSEGISDEIVAYYVVKTSAGESLKLSFDWAVNQGYTEYGGFRLYLYHNDNEVIFRDFTQYANPYDSVLSEKYLFTADGEYQVFKFVFKKIFGGKWLDSGRRAFLSNIKTEIVTECEVKGHDIVPDDDIKTPVTCSICDSTIYESDNRWTEDIYENYFEGAVAKFKGYGESATDEIVAYYVVKPSAGENFELSFDWAINQGYIEYGTFKLHLYHNDNEVITRDFTQSANPYDSVLSEKYLYTADGGYQVFKFVFEKTDRGRWSDGGRRAYLSNIKNEIEKEAEIPPEKNITLGTSVLKGGQQSKVYFGKYQQSSLGNTQPTDGTEGVDWIKSDTAINNGLGAYYSKDPIKWRVLSNEDGKLFLLSDQNLDAFPYHMEYEAVTWETSTMRSWLNGLANNKGNGENAIDYTNDNFLDTAFSASEQAVIADTTVVNIGNPSLGTPGSNNTIDKVFLLSMEEAQNTAYGFTDNVQDTNTRKATNTAYIYGGGKSGEGGAGVGEADWWWLRSPGRINDAARVHYGGGIYDLDSRVYYGRTAVRPAFNLNLSSVLFTSAANGSAQTDFAQVKEDYTGNEWKLTLKDDNSFADASVDKTALGAGETLTVTHKALSSFTDAGYNNVTAMLTDRNGNILCYGSVGSDTSETKSSITIPGRLAAGTYTLSVYGEDWNGENMTDYATGTPFTTTITVTEHSHSWDEGVLTRPEHNAVLGSKDGWCTYTCTVCGEEKTESVKSADYSAYEAISEEINTLLQFDELTTEAKQEIYSAILEFGKNNENVSDSGTLANNLMASEQAIVDEAVAELQKIIDDAEAKMASGEYVKADCAEIDKRIAEMEKKLADENVTDEGKARFVEMKAQFEKLKAEGNMSKAYLDLLEMALTSYEAALDEGIEDGTLVKANVEILLKYEDEIVLNLIEKYGEEKFYYITRSITDEFKVEATVIEKEAEALTGTVAENAEKIAELKERLKALYDTVELCFAGTHSFTDYVEITPAKCGVNAKETGTCWVCGETDEREVENSALTHKDDNGDYKCDYGCGHEFEKPVDPTPDEPTDDTCDHMCHKDGILGFFWKIFSFFFRLFNIQQYCDCGELHYEKAIFG